MNSAHRHSLSGTHWVLPKDESSHQSAKLHSRSARSSSSPLAADARVVSLADSLGIGNLLAAILVGRNLEDSGNARAFLSADADKAHNPMLLPDMSEAVEVIEAALENNVPIRIHGDYDVDGVAASALMQRALLALGGKVDTYVPHRLADGYGLGKPAVEKAAADGIGLLITVDCGSGSPESVAHADTLGLRVIVTDHHHPPAATHSFGKLRDVQKIEVNPRRADSHYPFLDLSGVGVAFKLVEALATRKNMPPQAHWRFLDLVALGTVADVSPLLGENRFFVKQGLELIGASRKVGLSALMKAAGLSAPISSHQVAFVLAPRLNAAGRLGHAKEAFQLLIATDPAEAALLADALCRHNRLRQEEEAKTLAEALEQIHSQNLAAERVLLLAGEGWHPGVIGIVASRLIESYHRPVFMVALPAGKSSSKTGATGSARSIPGFSLCDALEHCRHLLLRHGGHDLAAGFSVLPEKVEQLREALYEYAQGLLSEELLQPEIAIDTEAWLSDLTLSAVEEFHHLEPFGCGNPPPSIAVRDVKLLDYNKVGEGGAHLRLLLHETDGPSIWAIWFQQGKLAEKLQIGEEVDVCLCPMISTFGNKRSLELRVKDVAAAGYSG